MKIFAIVLLICVLAGNVFSQAQMSSADIRGTVTDISGAVLPGATVTVANIDTGVERTDITDNAGTFRFFVLPPGMYEVRIQLTSFSTYTRRPVQLTVGQTATIDAALQPATVQVEVLVQEDLPVLEPARTQQSDTLTLERIENLPINERDFLDFALLTPGVTDSSALIGFTLPQTPTSGLSFAGQSGRANSVTIDGVDNNDNGVAAVRSTMSQEAVLEFQINRSNFAAEFGRASGGIINIVSRSGTNNLTGNLFAFVRDQKLDARNPFAFGPDRTPLDPPFSRLQSGFTVGGPLRRDHTFFFLSYEGLRQRESRFVTFLETRRFFQPTASQTALIAGLDASSSSSMRTLGAGLARALTTSSQSFPDTVRLLESSSGVFPYNNNDNTASLRLDHALSNSDQMFGRLAFTDIDTVGGAFGGLKAPSRSANYAIQDFTAAFGSTHFFSASLVNEFRFQFANRDFAALPADPFGPEISINGVAFLGRDFYLPSTRTEKRFQWVDNVTVVAARHDLKFGGDFNYIPFDTVTEVFLGGRFIFGEAIPLALIIDNSFGAGTSNNAAMELAASGRSDLISSISAPISSLQSFNFGLPVAYQQGFGDPVAKFSNKVLSGYVQDTFKAATHFTVNAGLRYDLELQPSPIHRDRNNVGPRFGFAWSPQSRTVVRGGYGIYYAPVFEAIAFGARVLDGTQISQVFTPITGLAALGSPATSADVWALAKQRNAIGNRTLTPADIAPLGLVPGVTPSVLVKAHPNLVNAYSQQFSLGIDQEVPGGINLSANYIGNRGVKLVRSRNTNLMQAGTSASGPIFSPINPRILQDNVVESSGSSIYHGLALSASKRYSSNYQFQVSYTFSKAIDDTTDYITDLQAANQLDLRAERSLSSFDQRHRLVASGVLGLPFEPGFGLGKVLANVTVAPIFTYGSGRPFNVLLGFDANRDTQANTDRPLFLGRNAGKGPDYMRFDLRVAKTFPIGDSGYRLTGIFEAFNLFNRSNFSGVNTIVGNSSLPAGEIKGRQGDPTDPLGFTSAFDPRQLQLGVKFAF